MMSQILNSNIEFLNNIKAPNPNVQNIMALSLEHLNFVFV